MGFFDDIFGQPFGGMFDFNGDGKTDFGEQWVGYMIINDCMKEEEQQSSYRPSFSSYSVPSSSVRAGSYEADDPVADDSWRLFCEDGSEYGIDPYDYDSEEEYLDALEEAKLMYDDLDGDSEDAGDEVSVTVPIGIRLEITYPGKEQLEAINPADYPNKRTYRAAYALCEIEHGNPYIPSDSTKEKEAERYNFILSGKCIAAKYLTPYDGFLYPQAIKENFKLPISFEDEDEESKLWFLDIFMELAEEDPALAVNVWAWCVKEFGPYRQYMKIDPMLYNYIISSVDEYPEEFLDLAIEKLGKDVSFCDALLSRNPEVPFGVASFISRALELGKIETAQVIFTAVALNPVVKGKNIEDFVNSVIAHCSNWEDLEAMEAFKFYILPIIKKMNDKRIQRLLPKITDQVNQYIASVESSSEKYQYSRGFAWRTKYTDDGYDIDPLDYKTEEEYQSAVYEEKYGWRRWHREASRYDLDVNDFETEEEYEEALHQKQAEAQAARQRERSVPAYDPLAETDKTIYNFCTVMFPASRQPYHYLTGDIDVKIGDQVVVSVGPEKKEVVGTVVATSQHLRLTAPFPVDKAKRIIRNLGSINIEEG